MKIAIIGVGLAGSNVLRYILEHKNFNSEDEIYLFEKRKHLAHGKPFEKDTILKMLNTDPVNMSVNPNNSNEFVEWLNENKENPENFENITPREYYGEYIYEYFEKYFNHKNVKAINTEVNDIEVLDNNKYKIVSESDTNEIFDVLFLTLGHPKYSDFYNLEGTKNYICDPYPLSKTLSNIRNDDKVGLIGAGATSIDVFRYIFQTKKLSNPLYFLVRESIFYTPYIEYYKEKFTFSMDSIWIEKNKNNDGLIELEKIIDLIDKDLKEEGVDFNKTLNKIIESDDKISLYKDIINEKPQDIALIMAYLDKFSDYFSELYGLLSNTDQHTLHEKYDKKIDIFFSQTPFETSKWILDEYDKRNIKFVKNLDDIEVKNDKFLIDADEKLELDYLINTTGFDFNILRNSKTNKLIKNLYDKKIIDSDEGGNHINITWPNCNVISKKYGELKNMFCLGMWVYGSHYRANCAKSINTVTREVTNRFMDNLEDIL